MEQQLSARHQRILHHYLAYASILYTVVTAPQNKTNSKSSTPTMASEICVKAAAGAPDILGDCMINLLSLSDTSLYLLAIPLLFDGYIVNAKTVTSDCN